MRKTFAESVLKLREEYYFLTGDLGYNVLEPIQETIGERFINCGVAEQNMIGVASGIARNGVKTFCYSIAPFLLGRPFEFIRNDIVPMNLPVIFVSAGSGFDYGHAGMSHHAIDDIATARTLGLTTFAPVYKEDIDHILNTAHAPYYLRLARPIESTPVPYTNSWRKIQQGMSGNVVVALGTMAIRALQTPNDDTIWAVSQIPSTPPEEFWADMEFGNLVVMEEHQKFGGLFSMLTEFNDIKHQHAFLQKKKGSQDYLLECCGLNNIITNDRENDNDFVWNHNKKKDKFMYDFFI